MRTRRVEATGMPAFRTELQAAFHWQVHLVARRAGAGPHAAGLQACELQVLLMAGNPTQAHAAPAWRALVNVGPDPRLFDGEDAVLH
jgi:hypothetical protein